jgi:hypothetical protein
MTGDQADQLDIDAPIPYKLTALGRRDCAEIRADELVNACSHTWHVVGGSLECLNCQIERPLPRSSSQNIPSYLSPKDRK